MDEGGKELMGGMGENRVFGFYGKMGGGKSRLMKGVCEELGVRDVMK